MVRRGALILAVTGLATMAAVQTESTSSNRQDWQQECSARADRDSMSGALRGTFMRECVAGEKVDRPAPRKGEPSAPR